MKTSGKLPDWPPDKLKNIYLNRYAWPRQEISIPAINNTKIIVVIPCFKEPEITNALMSLYYCSAPGCHTEVITVINHPENCSIGIKEISYSTHERIKKWSKTHERPDMTFHVIEAYDMPARSAGVGLARKIGMDEAVRRFNSIGEENGVICCFDADCTCSSNYLSEIFSLYSTQAKANAALIHFEHPTNGGLLPAHYEAIIRYELHLRYYVNALKIANFPWAYQTIGSCITVSAKAYQKQGGMNKRKAGEDFYFLQKIFPLEHIFEIPGATVFPSARKSDRVPFGTGKAVTKYLSDNQKIYYTYHPKSFEDFERFNLSVSSLYDSDIQEIDEQLPESIRHFLRSIPFDNAVKKIKKNSGTRTQFIKSFYQWFNGFMALKYIHFARDHYFPMVTIEEAISWLFTQRHVDQHVQGGLKNALFSMRKYDKLNH